MKSKLFTLEAWFTWAIHNLVVCGGILIGFLIWSQVNQVNFVIEIPSIERTFKK